MPQTSPSNSSTLSAKKATRTTGENADKAAHTTGVGLLAKALHLLDLFQLETPVWSQSELIKATGFNRSTLNRLVKFLSEQGYLMNAGQKNQYSLGFAAIDLGNRASESLDFQKFCHSYMKTVSTQTNETVLLTQYHVHKTAAVCVGQIEGQQDGLRVVEKLGSAFPLYAGAASKAILAHLGEEIQNQILAGPLKAVNENHPLETTKVRSDLNLALKNGYAISKEETYPGVIGVSSVIKDGAGHPIGSIAVAAPINRMDDATIEKYGMVLKKAANLIENAMKVSS